MSGKARGKGQQHRSEGQWRSLLKRFDASGSSVEAFCRSEAISTASYYRWRARLGSTVRGATPARQCHAPVFVDAGILGENPARSARLELKLDLGEGWVLQLVRG
jgi:hypothetical protein